MRALFKAMVILYLENKDNLLYSHYRHHHSRTNTVEYSTVFVLLCDNLFRFYNESPVFARKHYVLIGKLYLIEMHGSVWECIEVYRIVWECTGVYKSVWELWECTGVYGSVRECIEVYGIVWQCTGVYGSVCKCKGVYGSV